jgi:hypothetical protein
MGADELRHPHSGRHEDNPAGRGRQGEHKLGCSTEP